MRNKIVLGLDLGTRTGWAYQIGKNTSVSGVINNSCGKHASPGAKFEIFNRALDGLLEQVGGEIHFVAYEKVQFVAKSSTGASLVSAAQVWGGFFAIMSAWCERHGIPYLGVHVGTLKKFATGNGRATKIDMMRMFQLITDRSPKDDNEADAFHVLQWGIKGMHRYAAGE